MRLGVPLLPLFCVLPAGCFNPDDGGGSAAQTEGSTETATTDTDVDPSGSPSSTADVTTAGATDSAGTPDTTDGPSDESGTETGVVTPECGDDQVAPGELCLPAQADIHVVGNGAFDLVIADLDGDGALDIATANRSSSTVSILNGDGVGGFGNPHSETVGGNPFRIAAADGDLDGDVDIVVAASPITILLNENNNYWQRSDQPNAFSTTFTDSHNDMVVLQGNGDPRLDVVISEAYAMAFVPGTLASGKWALGSSSSIGISDEGASGMAVTHWAFDGDGFADLVGLNQYDDGAWVVTGNGNGTFDQLGKTPEICPQFEGGRHVAVGDIDGDGTQDIVLTCMKGSLGYVLGNGDGTFGTPTLLGTEIDAHRPYLIDLDGDDDLDLVVPSLAKGVVLYVNDGTGQLSPDVTLATEEPTFAVAFGDLDGNGALDIATVFSGQSGGRLAVWIAEP